MLLDSQKIVIMILGNFRSNGIDNVWNSLPNVVVDVVC